MEGPLILTFDMGTQSARAMLVDQEGNIAAKVQKRYEQPYLSPEPLSLIHISEPTRH